MIETAFVTVLDTWINNENNEDCQKICNETKQILNDDLKKGFRVKFVTSCVVEGKMLVHYVLEKESK